ncbi:enoyl-CoA hydratase/isomerase family protein [Streptomyces sp. PRKS01-29]|nr:enoyl-CoA hydratase/isomerase family protein [Streptomyces sabulosicollis]MBI0293073.1 enoyl-CoA hydratase/isomerase family protein [Streptomyces sabulosicollis]
MDAPVIGVERDRATGVAQLRIDRPRARNALSTEAAARLLRTVEDALADDAVRVLVLSGSGPDFCVGADREEELGDEGLAGRLRVFARLQRTVAAAPKATVAAIEGRCVAAGAELAAACDIRVGADDSVYRFPGSRLGVPIGAAKLIGLVGLGAAKDLLLTSRWVTAHDAHRLGLLQRLVPPGRACAEATACAAEISANDPSTTALLKGQLQRFAGVLERIDAELLVAETFPGAEPETRRERGQGTERETASGTARETESGTARETESGTGREAGRGA